MKIYLVTVAALIILGVSVWYFMKDNVAMEPVSPEASESAQEEQEEPQNAPQGGQNQQRQQNQQGQSAPKPASAAPAPSPTPSPTPAQPAPKATYVNADESMAYLVLPRPGDVVSPNITISGAVRGNWFYEGTFPAEVRTPQGQVLLRVNVPAEQNWRTTELVQFSTSLKIPADYKGTVNVILRSNNPTAAPATERSVWIPVVVQ